MSRVIKFRAYQPFASLHRQPGMYLVDDMVWHQVTDDQPSAGEVFLTREIGTSRSSEFIEDVQVMQFTGFHDQSGAEIYEGDIVRVGTEYTTLSRENGKPVYEAVRMTHGAWEPLHLFKDRTFVLHGNIHENPELLR